MAWIAGVEHRWLGAVMQAVAWLLGTSRVMAGLHYPSDVLSGMILARVVAYIAMHLSRASGRLRCRH